MPGIAALLHCANDALRLGRTLEMLLPCDQILVIDHHSSDNTLRIARQYGATIVPADMPDHNRNLDLARHDWVFCLEPGESISDTLQASLFEWSALTPRDVAGSVAFSLQVREQTADERWIDLPSPETRLVPRNWTDWRGRLPAPTPGAVKLEGELLRFALP